MAEPEHWVYLRTGLSYGRPEGLAEAVEELSLIHIYLFREQLMPRSFALQGKAKFSLSSTALSRTIFFPRFLFTRSKPPNGPLPGDCRADG